MYRIFGGKYWSNGEFLANDEMIIETNDRERMEIELDEDDLITPGLIDFHAHLWSPSTISHFGVDEGRLLSEGIVGAQDPGSFGCRNWEAANCYWQNGGQVKIRSFLHMLPEGLAEFPPVHPPRPEEIDLTAVITAVQKGKETGFLQGVKIHLGWLGYKDRETDRKFLEAARKVADETGTHMMVHMSGQCVETQETVSMMKAGDVLTHVYSGLGNTILDEEGNVIPEVLDAKKRGVIFDIGASGKHFSWEVFRKAYAQGVSFDVMGSDVTAMSWQNYAAQETYHLFYFLSAMLNYGLDLKTVFQSLITKPARYMGIGPHLGENCLILKKEKADMDYLDGEKQGVHCDFLYLPKCFIHNKRVIMKRLNDRMVL